MNESFPNIDHARPVLVSPCVLSDGSDWGADDGPRGCGKSVVPVAATRVRWWWSLLRACGYGFASSAAADETGGMIDSGMARIAASGH